MGVTHKPKSGATLTGTEYEAADAHTVSIAHADLTSVTSDQHHAQSHTHGGDGSGSVAHSSTTGITATDHHAAPAAGPDANVTVDSAGAAGTASTFARSGHGHQLATSSSAAAAIGTAAAGTSGTAPSRGDHVHPTGAGTPSTQAFGDAAATGSGPAAAMTDHKHAWPALGTTAQAIGTSAGGSATTPSKSDHVHATGAGTPSTQAFSDAAATGSGPAAAMTDHKHAMPTLGFGLTGNSAPAVSLTNQFVKATATTSISAATYADVTGLALSSLAAGTWLVMAMVTGSSVNAHALMHVAITDNSNVVQVEGSGAIPASGTASVASLGSVSLAAIVSGGQVFKVRAARGLTTLTGTWTAMDGAGVNITNNLTDNSDKGSYILAIRIA